MKININHDIICLDRRRTLLIAYSDLEVIMSNQSYWVQIVNSLLKKGLTIATMESCTGGGIANVITNVPGASGVISESYVTYSNDAKMKLGVRPSVIEKYSVYSAETAMEMANVVKVETGADIGLGVTGQLGRIDPNNSVEKLNVVWFAIATNDGKVHVREQRVPDFERIEQKDYIINCIARALIELI